MDWMEAIDDPLLRVSVTSEGLIDDVSTFVCTGANDVQPSTTLHTGFLSRSGVSLGYVCTTEASNAGHLPGGDPPGRCL